MMFRTKLPVTVAFLALLWTGPALAQAASDDPWTLFGESPCGVKLGGWLSGGIYGNEHGSPSNAPVQMASVGDGFTVNQLWAFAEKAVDTGGCGTDWGFRSDFIFGVDGPDTQAFGSLGWDNDWDTSRDYGSAMPQLYAEIAWNDLTVKLGHFFTIIGSEVVPATQNFFYSHTYMMYYGEPFTHTGVLGAYKATEKVTTYAGWTQGWDTGFDNTPHANTFLGGLSVPVLDKAKLTWACSAGDLGMDPNDRRVTDGDIYLNSFVFEMPLSEKLSYLFQHDLANNTGLADGSSQWYGINQIVQYKLADRWTLGGRFEWFRDNDGTRISTNGPARGNYYEMTAGLNWQPSANLRIRPELRYDWFDGVAAPGQLPYNDGRSSDQFSGGFDFIVLY